MASLRTFFSGAWLLIAMLNLHSEPSRAQADTQRWQQFDTKRNQISRTGMLVLGSWALGNIGLSAVRASGLQGEAMYFNRMNLYWNAVNAAIAGFGYYQATRGNTDSLSAFTALQEHYAMEKILLFNAGLDVAYVVGGLYLRERGNGVTTEDKRNQLRGFGRSVMLQGGFLLLFDTVLFLVHHQHLQHARSIFEHLSFTGNSAAITLRF